jgi:hypothetical protein
MRVVRMTAPFAVLLSASCLPHLAATGPIPHSNVKRQVTAGLVVPMQSRIPGYTLEYVGGTNRYSPVPFLDEATARQVHVVGRATILPELWRVSAHEPVPYIDLRAGARRTWKRGSSRGALEVGGMPTIVPPLLGPVAVWGGMVYGAAHGVTQVGPVELFATTEVSGGAIGAFFDAVAATEWAYTFQASAGVALAGGPIHLSAAAGFWVHGDGVTATMPLAPSPLTGTAGYPGGQWAGPFLAVCGAWDPGR